MFDVLLLWGGTVRKVHRSGRHTHEVAAYAIEIAGYLLVQVVPLGRVAIRY